MRKRLGLVSFGVLLGLLTVGIDAVPAGADPMGNYDSVIQSVSVELGSSNAVVSVSDTTVGLSADGEEVKGSHEQRSLDPSKAANELPVRVVTHWRADWGEGWDLKDIEGKDGKVTITVDIQNVTARPQKISFDAAGLSQSRSAIVGAPITVMASVEIPNTTHVIASDNATNGVISSFDENTTVVQWAGLLAPPYTSALTSFTLSLQGENLHVPDFSIAAQKGFLSDVDPNNMVASAFSSNTSEMDTLVNQVIDLSAQLADILERTEVTMSETRRELQRAQDTIANKTINDLQNSSHALAASTQSLQRDLEILNANIEASLQSNNSAALAHVQTATETIETIIGDTDLLNSPATLPSSTADTCVLPSSIASTGGSLTDTLLSLSGSLDVYASVAGSCRDKVREDFLNVLGPENTQECAENHADSLTCTLHSLSDTIDKYDYAKEDSNNAIRAIPDSSNAYDAAFSELDCSARTLQKILNPNKQVDFSHCSAAPTIDPNVSLTQRIATAQRLVDTMKETNGVLAKIQTANTDILDEATELRKIVCESYNAGTIDRNTARDLLGHIDGRSLSTCSNSDYASVQPALLQSSLKKNAETQKTNIESLIETTGDIKTQLDSLSSSLSALEATVNTIGRVGERGSQMNIVQSEVEVLALTIDRAKQSASGKVKEDLETLSSSLISTKNGVNHLIDPSNLDSPDVLLGEIARSLSSSSGTIRSDSGTVLDDQQVQLESNYTQLTNNSNRELAGALTQIRDGFSRSTRDAQSANEVLGEDINRVLADIGTPSSGTGLLGSMSSALGRADAANTQIGAAGDATYSFKNVQHMRNNSEQLRRAQLRAGMVKADELGAFMRTIPASTHTTVTYSFTMSAQ